MMKFQEIQFLFHPAMIHSDVTASPSALESPTKLKQA
jgi:hypothetical protein